MAPSDPGLEPAPAPPGGERRRLDRAPGERFAPDAAAGGADREARRGDRRWLIAAVIVADVAAVAFFVLGLLDLGLGLVVIAGFGGWATGVALVYQGRDVAISDPRRRMATAALLGGWIVVGGMLLDWLYGLTQGGVMGPVAYTVERYGLVAPAAILAGAFVAAYRAR
jgi:hypothetical protein